VAETKSAVVVSAHAADFVWRAGGAIALYASQGWRVEIICLSFGERGESAKLWSKTGVTLDNVKAKRRQEAEEAAGVLGATVRFLDLGDYPLRVSDDALLELVDIYRELQPEFILTHSLNDPYNFDHQLACRVAQEARIIAQARGHKPGQRALGAPGVFLFEPHQPGQCGWKPQVLLDITSVWEKKYAAFRVMAAQEHLWEYYERVALQRGSQGNRNSARSMKYGEAYQRIFPQVTEVLE
jgi:4-oxalomesaconate hydratase